MYRYITKQEELNICIEALQESDAIALDLEFDKNRFRYGFNMCLMQIFDGKNCLLIDPLSPDLSIDTIFPILESTNRQIIVYSFGEDLRLLHTLGCYPNNIFDITFAYRLLDHDACSLSKAIENTLGITVGKSSQKSNWFNRPLSEQQLNYAADDVLYLFDLQEKLLQMAEEKGITEWIAQENKSWEKEDYTDTDNNGLFKDKDKKEMTLFEWHIYTKLILLREKFAEKLNRPSYQVIPKEYLQEMAKRPKQIYRFEKIKGIHSKLQNEATKKELDQCLNQAIQEAKMEGISETAPALPKMSSEEYQVYKQKRKELDNAKKYIFKPIQKQMIEDIGPFAANFIFNNRTMEDLFHGKVENLLPYKIDLLKKYAAELDADLSQWL